MTVFQGVCKGPGEGSCRPAALLEWLFWAHSHTCHVCQDHRVLCFPLLLVSVCWRGALMPMRLTGHSESPTTVGTCCSNRG